MYKFPVKKCVQCGEPLKVNKDSDINEGEEGPAIGHCPKCFLGYEMEKE